MYVFIYEAPNMSTETLQFPLDIPKYLLPPLPIVKLHYNKKNLHLLTKAVHFLDS